MGARRSHHLKAAVQQERMNLQPAPADGVRQGYLAQRFARPGPERPQRSEGGAEIDPDLRLGTVIGREIHRRHIGLQPRDIERCRGRRRSRGGACREPALRVQRPFFVGRAPAQNPDTARGVFSGTVQQHL